MNDFTSSGILSIYGRSPGASPSVARNHLPSRKSRGRRERIEIGHAQGGSNVRTSSSSDDKLFVVSSHIEDLETVENHRRAHLTQMTKLILLVSSARVLYRQSRPKGLPM